ncbi:MAG: redoxin domain-containing protein [Armatimonadetes bacterium]|nr:redoxin domain-containing protein [Armatimonadota bacterium]
MLGILLVAITVVPERQSDAADRFERYMSRANSLTVDIEVREKSSPLVGRGILEWRRPNSQRFTIDWGRERFEFVQSPKGVISIRHDWMQYHENFARNTIAPPAEELADNAQLAYPDILLATTLSGDDSWKPNGTEIIAGVLCDALRSPLRTAFGEGHTTVWIDPAGRVLRWHRLMNGRTQVIDITVDLLNYKSTSRSSSNFYSVEPPLGYSPASIPLPMSPTITVMQPAPLGKWYDARAKRNVDVAAKAKDRFIAIVFTDPESNICKAAEPAFNSLRQLLAEHDCELIELSLGDKQPDLDNKDPERPVFWDRNGEIERSYGIVGTPYIVVVDPSGNITRAWQGYRKELRDEMFETLLKAFDD